MSKYLLALTALSGIFVSQHTLRADEWDKKTVVTLDQEVQLPNVVLQPGTYVFKLVDSQSDRHIVQIMNKEENKVITTVLAIPNSRLQPRGKSVFLFWEVPAGQIPAVRAWFYPGDLFGQEFAYPKDRATQVASFTKTSVPTSNAHSAQEMNSTPISSTNENGQESELDKSQYTATTAPVPAPAPAPAPEPVNQIAQAAPPPAPMQTETAPSPAELPHTASTAPLLGIIGFTFLLGSFAIRRFSFRSR